MVTLFLYTASIVLVSDAAVLTLENGWYGTTGCFVNSHQIRNEKGHFGERRPACYKIKNHHRRREDDDYVEYIKDRSRRTSLHFEPGKLKPNPILGKSQNID